jgi:hypothetical protein
MASGKPGGPKRKPKSSEGLASIAGWLVGNMRRGASNRELRSEKFRTITQRHGVTKLCDS